MNERVVPKMTNFRVVELSNSPAKAGPMSAANALGLTSVPRLDLDNFESQSDSIRINQRFPNLKPLQFMTKFRYSIYPIRDQPAIGQSIGKIVYLNA